MKNTRKESIFDVMKPTAPRGQQECDMAVLSDDDRKQLAGQFVEALTSINGINAAAPDTADYVPYMGLPR